jgi:MFS family permease
MAYAATSTRSPLVPILIAGCAIMLISFGVRSSYGVFQIPIALEFGWPRAEFSMAIAIQNLAWGVSQPLFAAIGEKFGDRRALFLGAIVYAAGLALSSMASEPWGQQLTTGVMVGMGIAGTGFGVVLAMVGRAASDANRSMALGIATAAGSAGQVFGPPVAQSLIGAFGWSSALQIFAVTILGCLAFLPMLKAPGKGARAELEETLRAVLTRAARDPSYVMLTLGFFSCGYQLGFVTAHFPAFVTEACGPIAPDGLLAQIGILTTSQLGAFAIALIGVANIGGTLLAGRLGQSYRKKYLLALVYTGRTVVAAAFFLFPITPLSVVLFSLAMGSLWLATIPLTSGLVAYLFGLRYMGTLYGFVFLSHQIGSFIGIWLGGAFYDLYGNYDAVWWVGVGIGAFSAVIHLPVREGRPGLAAA